MLEKTTNLSRTAYLAPPYDYDELVQRDRVHQLIYTDPAIFTAEMTHVFGAVWVYLAHESQIPNNDDFITAKLGLRPIIVLRDTEGRDPRALQSLHPSRHDAVPAGKGQFQRVPLPLSRLDLQQ